MRYFAIAIFFTLFGVQDLFSQVYSTQYRLPDLDWQQIQTERFRVIYPADYREIAEQSLRILEKDYDDIQKLVGGSLRDFPFILNPQNDRSNGFVSPFNFRSEVEIAPIKGKALNPQSGSWLESVLPHELVHALHLSNSNPNTITGSLGIFSKDIERSIHTAAPLGVLEGIAVHHESHNTMPQSGRGNYPYFNNQFNALLNTPDEWSVGQLFHISTYTTPFNRHYVGGYKFIYWLQETYGDDVTRKAIERHHKRPEMGFGFALREVTGKRASELYNDFSEAAHAKERERLEELGQSTDVNRKEIELKASCRNASKPIWISESEILFYSSSCNRTAGFFTHSFDDNRTRQLYRVSITGDRIYDYNPETGNVVYSRYHADSKYDNVFRSDIHILNVETGRSERLSKNARLISPQFNGDTIYALQTIDQRQQLVKVDRDSGEPSETYPMDENSSVIEIDFNPVNSYQAALLGRKHGVQGIWIETLPLTDKLFDRDPDIVFAKSSVFDPEWHPSGDKLLFASDKNGTLNLYEYDVASDNISMVTRSLYNAFEGSFSPDGETLAYIGQTRNEQLPYLIERESLLYEELEQDQWGMDETVSALIDRPLLNRDTEVDESDWVYSEYRTGSRWLVPRYRAPIIRSISSDIDRPGLSLASVDQLNSHAYYATATMFSGRFWYDIEYQNRSFYPGFNVSVFDQPNLTTFRQSFQDQTFLFRTILQERGAKVSIPFRYRFEQNVRTTSLLIEPEYSLKQFRFLRVTDARKSQSDFVPEHVAGINTTLNFKLRQNVRDVQPNSGLVLFTQTRLRLNETDLEVDFGPGAGGIARFSKRRGFRAGLIAFVSPLSRFNQSLRVSGQLFRQSEVPIFNNQSVYSSAFSTIPLQGINDVGVIGTRYTIPITYPDDGGLTLPVYLSNIYLVLFSQTVGDLSEGGRTFLSNSRSIYGAGIRSRMRLSNLTIDIGIAVGFEPTRESAAILWGDF